MLQVRARSHELGVERTRPRSILTEGQWGSIAHELHVTNRELQILKCIFDGDTEAAIALALGISTHTVHAHIRQMYDKLGVGCRCELIVRVFAAYISLQTDHSVFGALDHYD